MSTDCVLLQVGHESFVGAVAHIPQGSLPQISEATLVSGIPSPFLFFDLVRNAETMSEALMYTECNYLTT